MRMTLIREIIKKGPGIKNGIRGIDLDDIMALRNNLIGVIKANQISELGGSG